MHLNSFIHCARRYCTAVCAALCLVSASGIVSADPVDEIAHTWYQIELIVFANRNITTGDEHWPAVEEIYPAQMLFIGPASVDDLSPMNLGQLKEIHDFEQLTSSAEPDASIATGQPEFLFQPQRRKRSTYSDATLTEDDLLAGITREISPSENAGQDPSHEFAQVEDGSASRVLAARDIAHLFETGNPVEAYTNLPEIDSSLGDLIKRIERAPQYTLLYHAAWRQQIQPMGEATPILLQGGNHYDDQFELDGYITISKSRYLHLDTHLWYTQFMARSGQSSIVMPDNTQSYPAQDQRLLQQYPKVQRYEAMKNNYLPVQTYAMIQSRKIKIAALHYVDHPAFGMLIKIEEYTAPQVNPAG